MFVFILLLSDYPSRTPPRYCNLYNPISPSTRGVRLSVVHPEITEMQTKAVVGALFDLHKEIGPGPGPKEQLPKVELMLPLVGGVEGGCLWFSLLPFSLAHLTSSPHSCHTPRPTRFHPSSSITPIGIRCAPTTRSRSSPP